MPVVRGGGSYEQAHLFADFREGFGAPARNTVTLAGVTPPTKA
jgi:hypothetical protein